CLPALGGRQLHDGRLHGGRWGLHLSLSWGITSLQEQNQYFHSRLASENPGPHFERGLFFKGFHDEVFILGSLCAGYRRYLGYWCCNSPLAGCEWLVCGGIGSKSKCAGRGGQGY